MIKTVTIRRCSISACHGVGLTFLLGLLLLLPVQGHSFSYRVQHRAVKMQLLDVGAALEAYYADHQQYPAAVDEYLDPSWKPDDPQNFSWQNVLEDEYKREEYHVVMNGEKEYWSTWRGRTVMLFYGISTFAFFAAMISAGFRKWKLMRACVRVSVVLPVFTFLAMHANGPPQFVRSKNEQYNNRRKDLNYWSDGKSGWHLLSVGPDMKRDIMNLSKLPLRQTRSTPEFAGVVNLVFDPTNGARSSGDLLLSSDDVPSSSTQR